MTNSKRCGVIHYVSLQSVKINLNLKYHEILFYRKIRVVMQITTDRKINYLAKRVQRLRKSNVGGRFLRLFR
jgi:hypothetical protein